ncbi:hypothetical protein CCR97_03030 [Rhodoplanes elegans]|uniref:Uncharacterized protein n=1 Tax=Rhodoplanes elegans TaxID=29408 RepID=A0A327KY78_9BRAD|nr:hypothetical protein [Rhodoplanes elegans]RAI40358.1 hypothetical protein CH338_06565 [Rhodoplanes elegans]
MILFASEGRQMPADLAGVGVARDQLLPFFLVRFEADQFAALGIAIRKQHHAVPRTEVHDHRFDLPLVKRTEDQVCNGLSVADVELERIPPQPAYRLFEHNSL